MRSAVGALGPRHVSRTLVATHPPRSGSRPIRPVRWSLWRAPSPIAFVMAALGLSTSLSACHRTGEQGNKPARDAVATPPTLYKHFTSNVPGESGLEKGEGLAAAPAAFVFALRFEESEGPQAWEIAIDESRFVWGRVLSRSQTPSAGAPARWSFLGKITERVFALMDRARLRAAASRPRYAPHDCYDCGEPDAFVYERAGEEESRILVASAGGGTKAPGSKEADQIAGWLFAVQRDVPKFETLFQHLQQ
jgi:hypothetical protein